MTMVVNKNNIGLMTTKTNKKQKYCFVYNLVCLYQLL